MVFYLFWKTVFMSAWLFISSGSWFQRETPNKYIWAETLVTGMFHGNFPCRDSIPTSTTVLQRFYDWSDSTTGVITILSRIPLSMYVVGHLYYPGDFVGQILANVDEILIETFSNFILIHFLCCNFLINQKFWTWTSTFLVVYVLF